jgi:hypothetical protein
MSVTVRVFSVFPLLLTAALSAQEGGSTFGQARTRALANLGRLPTIADVVVADIVNYRRHRLPMPRAGEDVALDVRCGGAIGDRDELVLQVGYTTAPADDRADLPPLDLALVIDVSGSMRDEGKLDAVKRALAAFLDRLRPQDEIALVTFDSEARVVAGRRPRDDGAWLRRAIAGLEPGSGTNLHGGLMLGLREIGTRPRPGASHRVLLLTDGIANQGVTDPEEILRDARKYTDDDIDLSTIGVGSDLNTQLLERLARGGHGLSHFVASAADIDKVFVQESEALVAPVARHVRLRIELPPGLHVEQVYGHDWRADGDDFGDRGRTRALCIDLPNLNRGVTGVVMLTCRGDDRDSGRGDRVRARCDYRRAGSDAERHVEAVAELAERRAGDGGADVEVKKNFAIAVLAQGLHDMAAQADKQRWVDADRALRQALTCARELFPHDDDADVQRVRTMAEDNARTLRRYVDRFRDY